VCPFPNFDEFVTGAFYSHDATSGRRGLVREIRHRGCTPREQLGGRLANQEVHSRPLQPSIPIRWLPVLTGRVRASESCRSATARSVSTLELGIRAAWSGAYQHIQPCTKLEIVRPVKEFLLYLAEHPGLETLFAGTTSYPYRTLANRTP